MCTQFRTLKHTICTSFHLAANLPTLMRKEHKLSEKWFIFLICYEMKTISASGVTDQTSFTIFCSSLSHQISKIKVDDLQCNMSVCQYNTIRFYLKQNQKTHQKQYWPAINVSWNTFYVRPLICSIIVPTELTRPP